MSGCDRASAALIFLVSFFFCVCVPVCLDTDSALIPGEVSLLFVRRTGQTHHPRTIPSIFLPLFHMWSLTAATRDQATSPDNHCGAARKCTKSKQRMHVCMCLYTDIHFTSAICSPMDAYYVSPTSMMIAPEIRWV